MLLCLFSRAMTAPSASHRAVEVEVAGSCGDDICPSSDPMMAMPRAEQLFELAMRELNRGDLNSSREAAEGLIELLSQFSLPDHDARDLARSHVLFAQALLILSSVYAAARAYGESSRMLTTCTCYSGEHIMNGEDVWLRVQTRATLAYNRAVLAIEEYCSHVRQHRGTGASLADARSRSAETALQAVRDARDVHLSEAESCLRNELQLPRLVLADVWHTRGVCHYLLRDYVDALEDFGRSLATRLRYGDDHGITALKMALTMEHMAHIYRHLPHMKREALRLLGSVVHTRQTYLAASHPLTFDALMASAVVAMELGCNTTAKATFAKARKVARELGDEVRARQVDYWVNYAESL